MINGTDVIVRCDACGDEIAVYASAPKGIINFKELNTGIEDVSWFVKGEDWHYCPECEEECG